MAVSHVENSSVQNVLDATQDLLNSIVDVSNEDTSVDDYLVLTAKGNFKWEGSFETLQNFINAKRISTATKWSTRVQPSCVKPVNWRYVGTLKITH